MITAQQAYNAKEALKTLWHGQGPAWMSGVGVALDTQGSHVVKVLVDPRKVRVPSTGGDYPGPDPRSGDFRYAIHDFLLPTSVAGVPVQVHMTGPILPQNPHLQVAGFDILHPIDSTQQAIDSAAASVMQRAETEKQTTVQQATSQVQSTVQQQAQQQGAALRAQLQPTADQVSATAKTWQAVGYVVAGAVVVGVGYYIYRSTK